MDEQVHSCNEHHNMSTSRNFKITFDMFRKCVDERCERLYCVSPIMTLATFHKTMQNNVTPHHENHDLLVPIFKSCLDCNCSHQNVSTNFAKSQKPPKADQRLLKSCPNVRHVLQGSPCLAGDFRHTRFPV